MILLISGYAILKCLEILCRPDVSFSSRDGKILVKVGAVVLIFLAGFMVIESALGTNFIR